MKSYKVTAYATLEMETLVEAESESEAIQKGQDRIDDGEISICVHGSSFMEGVNSNVFTLVNGLPDKIDVYEVIESEE